LAVRIGFAYNLKPPLPAPKKARDSASSPDHPDHPDDVPASRALRPDLPQPDLYAEWDEPETIEAIAHALSGVGEVIRLEANQDFPARLLETRPDFVFNIAEGLHGVNRESHVPAICEFFGVPYHASDPLALALTLHKGRAKEIMAYHGVPTAPFVVANTRADARNVNLPFPLFAKPALEGSGKGITEKSVCTSRAKLVQQVGDLLDTYQEPVLIESWLPGQEFTVAILGNGKEARCLPLVAMRWEALPLGAKPIYGYEAKWLWDTPDHPLDLFECPARIPKELARDIRSAALSAYRVLGCRDWCRVDVRCDAAGRPMVVELNPLPGVLPNPQDNSCFPKAARAAGMSYDELIQTVADIAWRRISGRSLEKRKRVAA
jgi:D-alanine-D-alanine ligase